MREVVVHRAAAILPIFLDLMDGCPSLADIFEANIKTI